MKWDVFPEAMGYPPTLVAETEVPDWRLWSKCVFVGFTHYRNGQAKLSSWPSGSVRWKNRSPHSASRGAVSGR
jgi:hypothetical protein